MTRAIVITILAALLSANGAAAGELEDYIDHVREVRMSATAEMNVKSTVAFLAGYSTLTYRHDEESGQYWPTYTSQTCASPEADPEAVAREQEARNARTTALVLEFHSLADLDGSGFVSDLEGSMFRRQVESGFLAAHLATEGPVTLERVASALGVSEAVAKDRLDAYAIMYPVFVDLELASALPGFGAPPVQELQD
jgi:hypothetical protein